MSHLFASEIPFHDAKLVEKSDRDVTMEEGVAGGEGDVAEQTCSFTISSPGNRRRDAVKIVFNFARLRELGSVYGPRGPVELSFKEFLKKVAEIRKNRHVLSVVRQDFADIGEYCAGEAGRKMEGSSTHAHGDEADVIRGDSRANEVGYRHKRDSRTFC